MQFKIHARSAIRQKLGFQDENRQEEIIRKRVFVEKEDSFIKGRLGLDDLSCGSYVSL